MLKFDSSGSEVMSSIEVKLDTESATPVPVVAPNPPQVAGDGEEAPPKPVVPDEPLPQRVEPIQSSGSFNF